MSIVKVEHTTFTYSYLISAPFGYFFFYLSRRLGISSRFSVYIIAVRRISSPKVHTTVA